MVDPGDTPLKENELLSEERYREMRKEYKSKFQAEMGAEAIKELLRRIEIEELSQDLREAMKTETSLQEEAQIRQAFESRRSFPVNRIIGPSG